MYIGKQFVIEPICVRAGVLPQAAAGAFQYVTEHSTTATGVSGSRLHHAVPGVRLQAPLE